MPCYDERSAHVQINDLKQEVATLEAMLCTVLATLEECDSVELEEVLDKSTANEAGINPKSICEWWKAHKAAHIKRRQTEMQRKAEQAARRHALSKLTPEERKLLGVK